MKEVIYYTKLFDIYKTLLTEKQQNIFSLYYEENLSLQEIADNLNVSKSYVGSTINMIEEKLINYENSLKILAKNQKLSEILDLNNIDDIKSEINKLLED